MAHRSSGIWGLLLICCMGVALPRAWAACGDSSGDADAVAAARTAIAGQCNCSASSTHLKYLKCARAIARAAQESGALSRSCYATVMRCASQSAIGRPGAVTCCTTSATGTTHARVKSNASLCRAPRGGTACVGYALSVCDACTDSGCFEPATPTPAPTPTATPVICPQALVPLPPNLVTVPLTLEPGSPNCGGQAFNPPAAPPFSGEVDDVNGVKLADLGVGCLYAGNLPALPVPSGTTSQMSVVGVSSSTLILGPSDGSGSSDCTRGAGPTQHCLNGAPGTDGQGACASDSDCGTNVGNCAPDAHCFFGPPVPTGVGPLGACVVNVLEQDICGSADLSGNTQVAAKIGARVYGSSNAIAPCPQCVSGTCDGGANAGKPCTAAGTAGTSADCPPNAKSYLGTLHIALTPLTTATSTLTESNADFCPRPPTPTPAQELVCVHPRVPTAFGLQNAGTIEETGSGLLSGGTQLSVTLGSTFCVPANGGGAFIDSVAGLPIPGAISTTGNLDLTNALPLLGGVLP